MICVGLTGSALFSFNKGDDRNFQIAKNLDIFNAIFKELDMFYVDTIDPEKVINMVLMLCWRRPTLTRSIILKKIIH